MRPHHPRSLPLMGLAIGFVALLAVPAAFAAHGMEDPPLSLSPEHLQGLRDAGEDVLLVDLRPHGAYARIHVRGARSLPLDELRQRVEEVPRSGRVVLYGNGADDATAAYQALRGRGHRNVMILEEGIAGWLRRGLPVEPPR